MQPKNYRAQVLLEPEQHSVLLQAARRKDSSISDLVRQIVHQWLKQHDEQQLLEQRMQALERLNQIRERIQQEYGVYQGNLLEEARVEQVENYDRVWLGEA